MSGEGANSAFAVLLFLIGVAIFFILTTPLNRQKKWIASFDPGAPPRRSPAKTDRPKDDHGQIELGCGVYWSPLSHPNPHVLIVGGSGSGKSWTIRLLAEKLLTLGFQCVLFDFHGDLAVEGAASYRIALDSEYGVNPLAISLDPTGGGPDPQRFEVLEQLRNAFKPMGVLQLALLDDCLKETYRKFGVYQEEPKTWRQAVMPHLGDLKKELEARIARDPKDLRARGLRTKLSLAFDFQIFSKPQVPYSLGANGSGAGKGVHVDLSKLPPQLQYVAADTLLKQILRQHQLGGIQSTSTYLLIDESKLCTPAKKDSPQATLNRIATEGRKFGLGLVVSTQFIGHLGRDVVVNTFTKIVMGTDKTEIAATARKFRMEESRLQSLREPGEALINFADSTKWKELRIGLPAAEQ
ncbi:DUF87 domain-containing protein [Acidobacteria bacterium AH-259-O06]|nr:DUF87 domain-containing protein [Acidobacteria bacterium AH-259-O06]